LLLILLNKVPFCTLIYTLAGSSKTDFLGFVG